MFIVTGISRGLGKALVEQLLDSGKEVVGIGRSNPFGDRIQFHLCDLSNPSEVDAITFSLSTQKEVTLINNAGILGDIGRISQKDASDLENVMQVNVFAPMALLRSVYKNLSEETSFTIVNISSGAANRSIPSWSSYCASKAALNRLTENFYFEEAELGRSVRAYAVSPGVIDTGMQVEIRNAPEESFSAVGNFIQMKEEGTLYSPEEAANRLIRLLEMPFEGEVLQDLRLL